MRNDSKGKYDYFLGFATIETFYASGEKGKEVRASGKGGSLARGYYGRKITYDGWTYSLAGPYSCRTKARWWAQRSLPNQTKQKD